jgi:restriction endonuclease S subunit
LIVERYDQDKFEEDKDNIIQLIENKGDIKKVYDKLIHTVSIDDILNNKTISLNPKDYNKKKIKCGKDYKLVKLGDIGEIINGYAFKSSDYTDNGIPILTIKHIPDFNLNDCNFIKENIKYEKYIIKQNDILISLTGNDDSIGTYGIYRDYNKIYCNQRVCILRINDNYLRKYIYFLFDGICFQKYIEGNGTIQKNISSNDISNFEIPKNDKKIKVWVDKISKPYDEKIKKEIRIKELENIIQIKIKNIIENEECEEKELNEICEIQYGTRITKSDNILGNIPVYGGGDITFYTNQSNRSANTLIISRYAMSKINTRLIQCEFYLNDSGLSLKTKDTSFQKYINYYFLQNNIQEYIYNICTNGSIQRNINMNLFKNMKIPIPIDKKLISNLDIYFKELEQLNIEVKDLEILYNKLISDLGNEAIINETIKEGKQEV